MPRRNREKSRSISTQKWQASGESFNRGYRFTYDPLNRLSEAVYGENDFSDNINDYNEKVVEYSANGMMKRFQRRGLKSDGEYGKVDRSTFGRLQGKNLHITLDGNRPVKIIEDAGNQTVYGAMEFQSHSTAETQYGYDGCGSLVWDANRQIARITYDKLNYPREVQFTNGNRIQYVYSPEGQKLRATWQTAVANIVVPLNTTAGLTNSQISSTTQTDYLGSVIYTGTASSYATGVSLSKYLFEGGYATVTPSTQPVFHFYTQDHLGNNRAVMGQGGTVEQITHYYPFGGFFADAGIGSSLQPYKYNGKELDRMHGLDLYDYGARQYDPIVPMFTQQDPLAEKYYHLSPYMYCGNNPVNAIDKGGSVILFVNGFHLGDGGSSSYWNGLDNQIMTFVGDFNAKYIDGSIGGIFNTLSTNIPNLSASQFGNSFSVSNSMDSNNLDYNSRYNSGKVYGSIIAKSIFNGLSNNEKIRIVTHSMGAAYAKGLIVALQEYANSNQINSDNLLSSELDLAPFQPDMQNAVDKVATTTISHKYDHVAGHKPIKDATNYITRKDPQNFFNVVYEHSIESFSIKEIMNYWNFNK